MFCPQPAAPLVLPARGAVITDALLEKVIAAAAQLDTGPELSDEAAALLTVCTAPLLRELLNHRRVRAVIADLAQPDNVVLMPAGRG